MAYLSLGRDYEKETDGDESSAESLGFLLVTYQDGKVDICVDVEKVEARWDSKQVSSSIARFDVD